jgi:hypothetical protein
MDADKVKDVIVKTLGFDPWAGPPDTLKEMTYVKICLLIEISISEGQFYGDKQGLERGCGLARDCWKRQRDLVTLN